MFKKFYATIIFSAAAFLSVFFLTCGDDSVNAPQDFISGTITFVDTNILHNNNYYYAVSIFGDSTNPFTHRPVESDSLTINISGGTASAYYKVTGLASGNYYVGCTYNNRTNGNFSVMGELGCGENIGCSTPTKITVPNYAGTGGQDFRSKTH